MFMPAVLNNVAATVGKAVDTSDPSFKISIGEALIFALIGFAIVFAVLLILNIFIRILSAVVRGIENGTKKTGKLRLLLRKLRRCSGLRRAPAARLLLTANRQFLPA